MLVQVPDELRNWKVVFAMNWDGLPRIDVEKSASHHLSQIEIDGDNPVILLAAFVLVTAEVGH
jgi:hypothetical protein